MTLRATVGALCLATGLIALPDSAMACRPVALADLYSTVAWGSELAESMVKAAATVDVVKVRSTKRLPVTASSHGAPRGYRLTFDIVERLKGDAPASFSFDGVLTGSDYSRGRGALEFPRPQTFYYLETVEITDWRTICSGMLKVVSGEKGATYLVFRDNDGRLLKQGVVATARDTGGPATMQGPVYERVFLSGDVWLDAVRKAASH